MGLLMGVNAVLSARVSPLSTCGVLCTLFVSASLCFCCCVYDEFDHVYPIVCPHARAYLRFHGTLLLVIATDTRD